MIIRYLIWLIVTFYVTYAFCLNTAAAVFSDVIKNSLNLSQEAVLVAMGAYVISFAFSQIPAGYLLDRYNPRYVISYGLLALTVGSYLASVSAGAVSLFFSNLIQGVGGSFAFIAAGVLIGNWFTTKLFPIMFGLTQSLSCVLAGYFHYQMIMQLEKISWNQIYHAFAWIGLILFVLSYFFVKKPKSKRRIRKENLKKSIKTILLNRQIMLCALAAAFSFGVLLAYASYWYMNIQKYYSVNQSDTFIISGLMFAGIGIGTPLLGWLSNCLKSRMMVIHTSLVLGVMVLLAAIYLPHYHIHTYVIIKSLSFLLGFFLSGSMLLYTVVSENTKATLKGVALSVTNTGVFIMNSVMLFFPNLIMIKANDLFFTYLWIFPFLILISILISYFIKETYHD